MSNTLRELLASQDELVREAALALPHSFSQCTYTMGYVRQAIYLCLTCATPRGVCYPCSVACHTDHEQVELFPKRHFRCDCPTGALSHPCGLHKRPEGVNTENEYGQNFEGKFCRCGRTYNAHTEVETMIQCLACEVCLSLLVCWQEGVLISSDFRIGTTNRASTFEKRPRPRTSTTLTHIIHIHIPNPGKVPHTQRTNKQPQRERILVTAPLKPLRPVYHLPSSRVTSTNPSFVGVVF